MYINILGPQKSDLGLFLTFGATYFIRQKHTFCKKAHFPRRIWLKSCLWTPKYLPGLNPRAGKWAIPGPKKSFGQGVGGVWDSEVPSSKCALFWFFSIQLLKKSYPEPWNYAQKALFKVPKICNKNFWIENDAPPPWSLFRIFIRFGASALPLSLSKSPPDLRCDRGEIGTSSCKCCTSPINPNL